MIKRLIVKNLNGKHDFDLTFHPDINIFIGKNGAGKTTLMKLIWALSNHHFKAILEDDLIISFVGVYDDKNQYLEIDESRNLKVSHPLKRYEKHELGWRDVENITFGSTLPNFPHSAFMPTFRRIEGGFFLTSDYKYGNEYKPIANNLQNCLVELSRLFQDDLISFVSVKDLVNLLTKKYLDISKSINDLQDRQTKFILDVMKGKEPLSEIQMRIEKDEIEKEQLRKPFTELSNIVKDIFNKGIKITENISIGDEANAISADKLSSGEKQMLSFFAYNMFYKKAAIFIDEPEISLHTDWQKVLFPSLLAQGTENQFFVATHSPFIYAKYPDKTFNLSK